MPSPQLNPSAFHPPSHLRGLCFITGFISLILVKCFGSEAFRLHWEIDINTTFYIWLPSLIITLVVSLLYLKGPGSPFPEAWKHPRAILSISLIALALIATLLINLPSTLVPFLIALLAGGVSLVLGRLAGSTAVVFLAPIWMFAGIVSLFFPPEQAYALLAIMLSLAGVLPSAIGFFALRKANLGS